MCQAAATAKPSIRMVVHDGAVGLTKYFGEHAIIWISGRVQVVEGVTPCQQRCSFVLRTVAHPGPVVVRTEVHQDGAVRTDRLVESGHHALRASVDLPDSAH